ncbi:hypothetical protein JTE90_020165 [Oedothorax gibbosus]|uniref:Transposase n=1 Tax=Oedothorax gibbosus TaxID=931172 RepID=A0AAV6TYH7_9ARAC|nr:hypothetical protein JTE90_020165 [Oedothorax gibbosus]
MRRDRSKIYHENMKLREENARLKKKIEAIRKKEYRKNKELTKDDTNSDELTPNSEVNKLLQSYPSVPTEVRKNLLFGAALEHQLKQNVRNIKSHKEKQIFSRVIQGRILKKYRLLTKAKSFLSSKMFKSIKTTSSLLSYDRNKNARKYFIEKKVTDFYLSDENSTQCPGKKDTVTKKGEKKQQRYLNDTLIELHKQFINKSNCKISYALFCRHRPFWVIPPKIDERDTCLCKHGNFGFTVASLKKENVILETSVGELVANLCCKPIKNSCYLRKCHLCKDKIILYDETKFDHMIEYKKWVSKKEVRISGKTKQEITVKITKKETIQVIVGELYGCLKKAIPKFLVHLMNISHQFKIFSKLKNEVSENEIILHIDCSENYCCKYSKEVQAVHFGASRQQITLHTGMMYTARKQESFCTLSNSLRHDPQAVMAHIMPLLKKYLNENRSIDRYFTFLVR